jgi:hypothetical protein
MRPLLVALVAFGVGLAHHTTPAPAPVTRMLFIGNSLTRANDLPELVVTLARAAGQPAACEVVAFNNFSLEDHWQHGDARKAIAKGGWSVVVLQQGPSALPESQVLLRDFTTRFDGDIRRAGARTALLMVWPSLARKQDFDGVSRSYAAAAADVGGLLFPAGDAWRAAWAHDATLALYGPDGFHPSPMGSYLAALTIVQKVFKVSPIGLPASGIPAGVAKLLQESAAEADRPPRSAPAAAEAGNGEWAKKTPFRFEG